MALAVAHPWAGGHLSSLSRKRSGMSDAVQPIDVRKVSLVGSSFEGLTTIDDMRAFWLGEVAQHAC